MDPTSPSDDAFVALSDEYAQALDAVRAIETQAELLVAGGSTAELRAVIDRFNELVEQAIRRARAQDAEHFPEWFEELKHRIQRLQDKAMP